MLGGLSRKRRLHTFGRIDNVSLVIQGSTNRPASEGFALVSKVTSQIGLLSLTNKHARVGCDE